MMKTGTALSITCAFAVLAACSSGTQRASSDCVLTQTDSAYLSGGPVYRDCAVDQRARLLNPNAPIDFRPSTTPRASQGSACFLAQVELVVDTRGFPETATARVVQADPPNFGNALLNSARAWRYEPALKDGEPVRQIVRERRAMSIAVVPAGSVGRPASAPRCR